MLPLLYFCFVLPVVLGNDKTSGISQFWADDYKIFDQIYGRTSDKELYGATLPPAITYNFDITRQIQQASDKKERYIAKNKKNQLYNDFRDENAKILSNYLSNRNANPALQFISLSDLKPISESNDPDTYNYLKHLEQMTKQKKIIQKINKIKSHDSEAEADEAYRSIQDILDAHEANKKETGDSNEDRQKIKVNSEEARTGGGHARGRNRNKVRQINGNSLKSRDVSSRYRKPAVRATRPYIRKIRYHYTK